MASGLMWHISQPVNPTIGDCYFDESTGIGYIWQGSAWVIFSGEPHPQVPFIPPTKEQLEKHPSLRAAWEDFIVIKRLLGV